MVDDRRRPTETYENPGGSRGRAFCMMLICAVFCGLTMLSPTVAIAQAEPARVVFRAEAGGFPLVRHARPVPLYVEHGDWPGVVRAVSSFADDLKAVTGERAATLSDLATPPREIVLIGTIGRSPIIDRLVAEGRLDVSALRGHWEMSVTQVVTDPLPGIHEALVIAGSDKRGTIFGVYGLSEQMGVSPWAWWADVATAHRDTVTVSPARFVVPEPRVRYRGIFLNDEAPSLSRWTQEKFGGYNHKFYEHVFELLLRLRANYLWPAMWNNAFNEDDLTDPALADEYGIVMGTSHHEPMLRAQQEWKRHGTGAWDYATNAAELQAFWSRGIERNREYESTITIGMRGDGDMAMSPTANTALLEKIVADQRRIIAAKADPNVKNPQIWALYKEVQQYYEQGMRVPDDVTLLWCDDNWGNLRRLPTAEERKRPGGAGIYYHFDYVGDPRSYKWLLTYNISKVWEQMRLAADYGADRVWIVNVGDLKPMEFAIEFFLTLARDPDRFGPDDLQAYTQAWAKREFGPGHAEEIADLVDRYTRYNSRRKPEQLETTTYRITPGGEADRVAKEWQDLTAGAEAVNRQLPAEQRPSFYELVLYPLKASATVGEMYLAAGRNNLYAAQGRRSANYWAAETQRLFALDAELSNTYHHLLNGKWNHMMDQTHIGYTFWNEPPENAMPAVQYVQLKADAGVGVFAEGSEQQATSLPDFDSVNRQVRTLEIAALGDAPGSFKITASVPWIKLSRDHGPAAMADGTDVPVQVSVDWDHAPAHTAEAVLTVSSPDSSSRRISVRAVRLEQAHGYVEDAGVVTIEAQHFSVQHAAGQVNWKVLPGFGLTLSGVEAFPTTAPATPPGGAQACLDYEFTTLAGGPRKIQMVLAPTLPFTAQGLLRLGLSLDSAPQRLLDVWNPYNDAAWRKAVSDGTRKVTSDLGDVSRGAHTLHVCRVDPGVVLERLMIYTGAPPAEYLGPPESRMAAH